MIKQIANKHNLVVARRSQERVEPLTFDEFVKIIDEFPHETIDAFVDHDSSDSLFISSIHTEDDTNDVAELCLDAAIRAHQSGHSISYVFTTYAVHIFGLKVSGKIDENKFIAAVNKKIALVEALRKIIE
jgi:hypothetical protein